MTNVHAPFEDLAFAAIDFTLEPAEAAAFEDHLAGCEGCRAMWRRIQADQAVLRETAVVPTPARVRTAVLAAAAARERPRRATWQLVAVAALLIAALGVAMVGVAALRQRMADDPAQVRWDSVSIGTALAAPRGSVVLTDVAFGDGRYVMVNAGTDGPRIAWSTDGRRWEAAAWSEPDALVEDVIALDDGAPNERFALVGEAGGRPTVWWSADGMAWRAETLAGEDGRALGIAARDGVVIVVGQTVATVDQEGMSEEMIVPAAWRRAADDGPAWRPMAPLGDGDSGTGIVAVAATDDGFAAVTGAGSTIRLSPSNDWSVIAGPELNSGSSALTSGGGRLVVVSNQNRGPLVHLLEASGIWREPVPLPDAASAVVRAVTFRDGRFLAGGSGPAGAVSWASTDGRNWQRGEAIDGGGGALINDLAWGPDQVVAIGARGNVGAVWIGREGER